MPDSIELPILGTGIAGRSRAVTAQKRQNIFIDIKPEKDKNELAVYGTPGLKFFSSAGSTPCRGIWWFQPYNFLYTVCYDELFEIHTDGTIYSRGHLLTTEGNVSFADNGSQIIVVDGLNGYIFQKTTPELTYIKPLTVGASYASNGTTVTVTMLQPFVTLYVTVGQSVLITVGTGPVPTGTYTVASVGVNTFTFAYTSAATTLDYLFVGNTVGVRVNEPYCNRKTGETVEVKSITGGIPDGNYTVNRGTYNDGNLIVGNTYVITNVGSSLFTNIGAALNEVGTRFSATGTTAGILPDDTTTAGNGTVVDADYWYTTDSNTGTSINGTLQVINNFRNITDTYDGAAFPGADTVVFIDSYFVINNPGTKQFWLSGQYDGFYWDPLMYASKEAYTDDLSAVAVDNGNLVLLGDVSQEYWQNAGSFPFPFQRIAGSPTDTGLAAKFSVARCAGELFYLAKSRRGGVSVIRVQNYQPIPVSTPDLDYLLNKYTNVGDAVAFSYRQNGHDFYQINFLSQNASWLYDATSDAWSVMQSGDSPRHYANKGTQLSNEIIVTDFRNGNLYVLDPETYTDNGDLIARELITPHFFAGTSFNKLHIYRLRLDMEQGIGLVNGQGSDPQVMLQVSRDGGYTYGNEMWSTPGAMGEYLHRAEWRRLGVSRNYVFKFRITDPVKVVLISAAAYATMAAK